MCEQEENNYQEIKDQEKEVEELLRILVGDKETQKPKRKNFLKRLLDRIWRTESPYDSH